MKLHGMILFILLLSSSGCHQLGGRIGKQENAPAAGSAPISADGNSSSNARARAISVLLDVSGSYQARQRAMQRIITLIDALGPGDRFLLAYITGSFSPERNVKVLCALPSLPPSLLVSEPNLRRHEMKQAQLHALWAKVDQDKQAVAQSLLHAPEEKSERTDLFTALAYCSRWLTSAPEAEKYLFIFSDLEQDADGEKQTGPPAEPYPFDNVRVEVLFLPWEAKSSQQARENRWRNWFQQNSASHFSAFDAAESEIQPLVLPSPVPRSLRSLFQN